MPVEATATVDPKDLENLSAVLAALQKETGRSAEDSVVFASMKITASARSAAKIGKKNRDSIVNPEWNREAELKYRRAQGRQNKGLPLTAEHEATLANWQAVAPFAIVVKRQEKPDILLASWEKKDPRREIENRGLAKKTFDVMYGKLGAMRSGSSTHGGKDYRVSKYQEKYGNTAGGHAVRLINRLPYVVKAYPALMQTAITNGTTALKRILDQRIARASGNANRGSK